MKEINNTQTKSSIGEALHLYGENLSAPKDTFISILNQIPEKETHTSHLIKSPYKWIAFMQLSTLCLVAFISFPAFKDMYVYRNDSFYFIDKQVQEFESNLDDSSNVVLYYNDNINL